MFPQPQKINVKLGKVSQIIEKNIDSNLMLPDEYIINANEEKVTITGASDRAIFYAEKTLEQMPNIVGTIHDWAECENRIIMIDLKRISWNQEYLLSLFEKFGKLKINYCLIEYEDKFPFKSAPNIPVNHLVDPQAIENAAKENHIEIIPLVQCFSHWEYVLKHYPHLCEVEGKIDQACPENPQTFGLFKSMALEVMNAHPRSKYFHIGADESRSLGKCEKCNFPPEEVYGKYVSKVLKWVKAQGKEPIFWGDILLHLGDVPYITPDLGIVCDWQYLENKYDENSLATQKQLLEKQFNVWSAGILKNSGNIATHAQVARDRNIKGVFATYWGASNSLLPPPTIYPMNDYGVYELSGWCWNSKYEKENQNTFNSRINDPKGIKLYLNQYGILTNDFIKQIPPETSSNKIEELFLKKAKIDYALSTWVGKANGSVVDISKYCNSTKEFVVNGKITDFTSKPCNFLPVGKYISREIEYYFNEKIVIYGALEGINQQVEFEASEKHPKIVSVIQSRVGGYGESGFYKFNYSDGTTFKGKLDCQENIGSWWSITTKIHADIFLKESILGIHRSNFINPHPEKELVTFSLEAGDEAITMLAAITMVNKINSNIPDELSSLTILEENMNDELNNFTYDNKMLCEIMFKPYQKIINDYIYLNQ